MLMHDYSPKLKATMEKIKKILEEDDVAAVIVLHHPGFSEYVIKINPSYSCASMQLDGGLRVRAKLEDFGGDVKARTKKIADTSNMFKHLTETGINILYPLHDLSERIDKIVGAEHDKGGHSSHTTQNN